MLAMRNMQIPSKILAAASALLLSLSCSSLEPSPGAIPRLDEWMVGSFSSAAQAAADESYFDIRLEMVPIWTERRDATWFAGAHLERGSGD